MTGQSQASVPTTSYLLDKLTRKSIFSIFLKLDSSIFSAGLSPSAASRSFDKIPTGFSPTAFEKPDKLSEKGTRTATGISGLSPGTRQADALVNDSDSAPVSHKSLRNKARKLRHKLTKYHPPAAPVSLTSQELASSQPLTISSPEFIPSRNSALITGFCGAVDSIRSIVQKWTESVPRRSLHNDQLLPVLLDSLVSLLKLPISCSESVCVQPDLCRVVL